MLVSLTADSQLRSLNLMHQTLGRVQIITIIRLQWTPLVTMGEYHHSLYTGFTLHPVFVMDFDWHTSDFIGKSQFERSRFFSWRGLGVPHPAKKLSIPPSNTCPRFLDQGLSSPAKVRPPKFENLNTFLCQIWLLLSSKVPYKAVFHA